MATASESGGGTRNTAVKPVKPAPKKPAKKAQPGSVLLTNPLKATQTPAPKAKPAAPKTKTAAPTGSGVKAMLDFAMSLRGTPYLWGGKDPSAGGLDCSGLIAYAYGKYGINVNGPSRDQAKMGTAVNAADAQPGDLIAFDVSADRPGIDHIAIYLGDGLMLVAPKKGDVVKVQRVNLNRVAAIRRVIPENVSRDGLVQSARGLAYDAPDISADSSAPATLSSLKGGTDSDQPSMVGAPAGTVPLTTAAATGAAATPMLNGKPIDLKTASDANLIDYARQNYPFMAGYLTIPEIRNVLFKAMREGWDDNRLQGAISGTTWWKTTAPTVKAYVALKNENPAAFAEREKQTKTALARMAAIAGVVLTPSQINDLSDKKNRLGWTDDQITVAIADQFKYQSGKQATGTGGGQVANLKALADEYLVRLSDTTVSQWAQAFMQGTANEATFKTYLIEQAKSLYPNLTAPLDAGISVRQYLHPYVQDAAQILEKTDAEINLNDDKWLRAINKVDPKTGERTVMSRGEWADYLRSQPEFAKTKQAWAQAADIAEGLGREFGKAS